VIVQGSAGIWTVLADIDGNTVADIAITVNSATAPTAGDFFLWLREAPAEAGACCSRCELHQLSMISRRIRASPDWLRLHRALFCFHMTDAPMSRALLYMNNDNIVFSLYYLWITDSPNSDLIIVFICIIFMQSANYFIFFLPFYEHRSLMQLLSTAFPLSIITSLNPIPNADHPEPYSLVWHQSLNWHEHGSL